ncbi:MAG: DNA topoisomerase, partial [Kiloniellales bacterium]
AQEAHEAIRPTDLARRPEQVARHLDQDSLRLYELIWTRTLASQMESARLDQVAIDIAGNGNQATLRANGSVVKFDGFFALYKEGLDDPGDDERELRLPPLKEGDPVRCRKVAPEQHFTQPPPRFTEASLVKRLEELGIGRPSTYASILQVLQDRDYVRLDKKRFLPEDRGRLVTAFLSSFFERYFQYNFTADLEEQLDDISGGRKDWKLVLRQFWDAFSAAVEDTKDLSITNVIDALDHELGPHFFPSDPRKPGVDPRLCPACGVGRLGLKLGRNGGFIGCSGYPDCRFTRPLGVVGDGDASAEFTGPRELGEDTAGLPVTLRRGPFGIYIQLGDAGEDGTKPKRVSLPKNISPDELTLEKALALLALPREIGRHPDTGNAVTAGIGRFGPYVRHGSTYRSLPADEDVLVVGLNRAVALLAEAKGGRGGAQALKTLGDHPGDGKPVTLHAGRYGPYVKHGKVNATLPKDLDQDTVTLDAAVGLLAAQAEKKKTKGGRKKANGSAKPQKSAAPKSKSGSKKRASPRRKKGAATAGEAATPGKEAD